MVPVRARMAAVPTMVLMLLMLVILVRMSLVLELLCVHVHLHGIVLPACSTVHHAMLALMVSLVVHAVRVVRR